MPWTRVRACPHPPPPVRLRRRMRARASYAPPLTDPSIQQATQLGHAIGDSEGNLSTIVIVRRRLQQLRRWATMGRAGRRGKLLVIGLGCLLSWVRAGWPDGPPVAVSCSWQAALGATYICCGLWEGQKLRQKSMQYSSRNLWPPNSCLSISMPSKLWISSFKNTHSE